MAEQFGSNPWPREPSGGGQLLHSTSSTSTPTALSSHPADVPAQPLSPTRTSRTWPALLTLYVLAPVVGEVLSGSTPPLNFINPFTFLLLTGLYGSGAIIARELVRRRGLGWTSILLLGAAYGILEEGLVVTSWFNPYWPDLGVLAHYGQLFDVSWFWAFGLTTYHAVVSITIPIVLTEALFPHLADRPWLSRRGLITFSIWLAIVSLFGLLLFGFLEFSKRGYTHPPLSYFIAVILAVVCVWLALRMKPPMSHVLSTRDAPRLWQLRLMALATTMLFFFDLWAMPHLVPFPVVPIAIVIGLVAAATWVLRRWAQLAGWGQQHRLALAFGALTFFVLLSPIVEFYVLPHSTGKNPAGLLVVDCLFLLGLVLLSRRVRLRQKQAAMNEQNSTTPAAGRGR